MLGGFKQAIDEQLSQYFDTIIDDISHEDPLLAKALLQTRKIALAGGKRIRGALLQTAYFGAGGKEKEKILQVACAIELLHLFFLIHDDIIDKGNLRHGEQTLQNFFANEQSGEKADLHYGNSMALIVGDLLFAKANELILQAGFAEGRTLKALQYLQGLVATTILGQTQDISIEFGDQITVEKVLEMYEHKTAQYTFAGPLQMGLILAGKEKEIELAENFANYASAVGKAYQIQDDLLGVFADSQKLGKSTVSDIEEGKQSLLVVFAKLKADELDKGKMTELLGRKNLTENEIARFKDILIRTGAKQEAVLLAEQYLKIGKQVLEKVSLDDEAKFFLMALVEYLEGRET